MSVLDRLFTLEIEFHRLFRAEGVSPLEAASVHTSYALQHGYEPLIRAAGPVDPTDLAQAAERMTAIGDPREVRAACRSLQQFVAFA